MDSEFESIRKESEVDNLIDRVIEQINQGGSKFPGMSYEEGLRVMYDWLNGDLETDPLED